MKSSFWKNKSVFVTGHTGFKGSWLCLWLQLMGARVTGYATDPPTSPSLFELADVANGMTSIKGDVRDAALLLKALRAAEPEIVIHLAAQPLVRESYADPVTTYSTNVLGAVHLLDAVRQTGGIKAVAVITSDKCYENREWFWSYREKSMLGGDDPYSSSKACAEMVVQSFRKSFFDPSLFGQHGVSVASARAGNVIGGGDWAKDRIVPDTMRSLIKGKPIVIRNPHSTRPWQHVLEPLNGYLTLAEALYNDGPRYAGAWNFGPFDFNDKTVGWIVEQLYSLWGVPFSWERDEKPNPHENTYLKLDSSKARALLNWSSRLDLPTTLGWIVDWTKAWQSGARMRDVTERQISEFVERDTREPASSAVRHPLGILSVIGGFFGIPKDLTAATEAFLADGLNFASEGLNLAGLLA
jgi:CDP-glucose 4,6-dehydratase